MRKQQKKGDFFDSPVKANYDVMTDSEQRASQRDESFTATDEAGMRLQLITLIQRLNFGIKEYESVSHPCFRITNDFLASRWD